MSLAMRALLAISVGIVPGLSGAPAEAAAPERVAPTAIAFGANLLEASAEGLPAWIRGVGFDQGSVGGDPPAWHGAADLPEGAGSVWIDLHRGFLNENLALTLLHAEGPEADLAVQLWDAGGRVVALDLFRNALAMADLARTDTFILPLREHPSATRIVLRRVSGDIRLYGCALMPVVTEEAGDLGLMLETARRLGDPVSPEGDLMRRIAEARRAMGAPAAADPDTSATAPAPLRPVVLEPARPAAAPEAPRVFRCAGFEWVGLRTEFAAADGTIRPLPRARPGFAYGHCGHGRSPTVVTGVGSGAWRDYSLEVRVASTGVDPALDPHRLDPSFSGFAVLVRVADCKESWNEPGISCCLFSVKGQGTNTTWTVGGRRNFYSASRRGWFDPRAGGCFELASGRGLAIDRGRGNLVRIDVAGDRLRVWYDGEPLCDVSDPRLHEPYEGVTLDHGGFGVAWAFDTMGWARDIRVRRLEGSAAGS
jgi:hypothetical protein